MTSKNIARNVIRKFKKAKVFAEKFLFAKKTIFYAKIYLHQKNYFVYAKKRIFTAKTFLRQNFLHQNLFVPKKVFVRQKASLKSFLQKYI